MSALGRGVAEAAAERELELRVGGDDADELEQLAFDVGRGAPIAAARIASSSMPETRSSWRTSAARPRSSAVGPRRGCTGEDDGGDLSARLCGRAPCGERAAQLRRVGDLARGREQLASDREVPTFAVVSSAVVVASA
jgi:hypothetical protein